MPDGASTYDVRVLGTTRVLTGDEPEVGLGARKPRSVLAALCLHAGTPVTADALVDLVWGEQAPAGAHGTLHAYISGLRRVLEPALQPRERPSVLLTTDRGYRLDLPAGSLDAQRFAATVRDASRVLAPLASQLTGAPGPWPEHASVTQAVEALEETLAAWRGRPYDDLPDHPDVVAERSALEELRRTAEEDRILGLLALGEHATVVAATEQAVARDRWRERAWALHTLALARSGRQAAALAALREVRRVLADELGIDPGAELRGLEELVLRQDPALTRWLAAPGRGEVAAPEPVRPVSGVRDDLVGRAAERTALGATLDLAGTGRLACAALVGEPGIGKTRLIEQLVDDARDQGFAVAVGRSSQDDGAPPLWPWVAVLRDLESWVGPAASAVTAALTAAEATEGLDRTAPDGAAAFRTWAAIRAAVVAAAAERPLLVVLEDLHWADTASLRALRHLLDTATGVPLVVTVTRRPWPEPTGAAAEVAEALARRHVTRLDLVGLPETDTARLVARTVGQAVPLDQVQGWQERSGGNPFFVIELARLAASATGAVGPGALPPTLRDVLHRRLGDLPEGTRALLPAAAALGRSFLVDVLAAVEDVEPEEVEVRLEPAYAAGLLRDLEPGLASFAHALVRDAVTELTSASRRARLHARIAHAYSGDPRLAAVVGPEERVSELALHWLAAGPGHVGAAWRAAAAAAAQARRVFSHEEAAALMAAAVEAHRRDPAGTPEERHALLLTRAGDCQRAADWNSVVDCAVEAMAMARSAGEPARLAEAAAEITRNGLWTPHDWHQVIEDVVDDLRWALAELPAHDSVARCRAMLALAVELYYDGSARAELGALTDEGMAMARRLDDPELHWWATRAAWIALWQPGRLADRTALGLESLEVARRIGDPDRLALSHAVVACGALESGDPSGWAEHSAAGRLLARRRRLAYPAYVLEFVEVTLAGMRGDAEAADAGAAVLHELLHQIDLPARDGHVAGIALARGFWEPALLDSFVEPMTAQLDSGDQLALEVLYAALARAGRVEELAERLRRLPPVDHLAYWGTPMDAALVAEVAFTADDRDLAARAAAVLEPMSGRMAVAGFSVTVGPVDGFLALASWVLGNPEAARRYADAAVASAEAWRLTRYLAWLQRHRAARGF